LAAFILSSLPSQAPSIKIDAGPDLRVIVFALALTLITTLLFGALPALHASRIDLTAGMKQDSTAGGRRTTGLLRNGLVAGQMAVCMLLMIVAGLLGRALYSAEAVDPGFEFRSVAQVSYDMRGAQFTDAKARAFQASIFGMIRAVPGIDAVAFAETAPLGFESHQEAFAPEGMAPRPIQVNAVSPEYFALIGTPLVLGVNFTGKERPGSDAVIVTESTARLFWPGHNPLGQALQNGDGGWRLRVTGVVRDAQLTRIGKIEEPFLYVPASSATPLRESLLIRTRVNVKDITAAILDRVRKLDPAMDVTVTPLSENLSLWRTIAQLMAGLSGSLSGLGLALASIGIYGVVSYSVGRRFREVGIRMALGASAREVRSMILKQALGPVLAGAGVGLLAAGGIARILQSVLFGVSPYDPIAFAGAPLFLIAIAAAASLMPARRAMKVDPMTALRYE
jgi:predicted permease